MGEITTEGYVDLQKIVRDVVRDIGYTRAKYGFDADTCAVISNIDEQSPARRKKFARFLQTSRKPSIRQKEKTKRPVLVR